MQTFKQGQAGRTLVNTILILAGIGLIGAGAVALKNAYKLIGQGETAEATVTGRSSFAGLHPEIEFVSPAGGKIGYRQTGITFGLKPTQKVDVIYLPSDPINSASINTVGGVWGDAVLFFLFGLLAFFVGMKMNEDI